MDDASSSSRVVTAPHGMRTEEHVEGLTLIFRENHHLRRRGVRLGVVGLVLTVGFAVLALAGLGLVVGFAKFGVDGLMLVSLVGVSLSATLAPILVAMSGAALGMMVVHDAGQTQVHLTVGVRGITVERQSEREHWQFAASEHLIVEVDGEGVYPVLVLADDRQRVEIPVLAKTESVEWLAVTVRDRCAKGGNADGVPVALQRARQAAQVLA